MQSEYMSCGCTIATGAGSRPARLTMRDRRPSSKNLGTHTTPPLIEAAFYHHPITREGRQEVCDVYDVGKFRKAAAVVSVIGTTQHHVLFELSLCGLAVPPPIAAFYLSNRPHNPRAGRTTSAQLIG
jgi:hypothetical protein